MSGLPAGVGWEGWGVAKSSASSVSFHKKRPSPSLACAFHHIPIAYDPLPARRKGAAPPVSVRVMAPPRRPRLAAKAGLRGRPRLVSVAVTARMGATKVGEQPWGGRSPGGAGPRGAAGTGRFPMITVKKKQKKHHSPHLCLSTSSPSFFDSLCHHWSWPVPSSLSSSPFWLASPWHAATPQTPR